MKILLLLFLLSFSLPAQVYFDPLLRRLVKAPSPGPLSACAAAPGDTTGLYQALCIVPATGALWACTEASGCALAADWTAAGSGSGVGWTVTGLGSISGTATLDLSAGNQIFTATVTGTTTFDILGGGQNVLFQLVVTQDGTGGRTVNCDGTDFAACPPFTKAAAETTWATFSWDDSLGKARPLVGTSLTSGVPLADGSTLTLPATGPATAATTDTTQTISGAKTFTGVVNAGGASRTAPAKVGTTAPATCTVGDVFFDSDATAGQNVLGCTATDTWTLQSGGVIVVPIGGSMGNTVIATGATIAYIPFSTSTATLSGMDWDTPVSGTLKNFRITPRLNGGAQSGGTLQCRFYKNGVEQAAGPFITLADGYTSPASDGTGNNSPSDLVNTVSVTAGDHIRMACTNNASGNSISLTSWSAVIQQ